MDCVEFCVFYNTSLYKQNQNLRSDLDQQNLLTNPSVGLEPDLLCGSPDQRQLIYTAQSN